MAQNREEFVYHKIKTAIVRRYIREGSQLVETTLAAQLGVSRTPVRGAIKRLVYEGFAHFKSNRGVFVVQPTAAEIRQTFAVRSELETMAARLAARHIDGDRLKRLEGLLQREKELFERRDLDDYYRVNDDIHFTIAQAARNSVLHHYVQELVQKSTIFLILYDPFFRMEINPSIEEHHRIVEALKRRQPAAAERAMAAHLDSALAGMELKPAPPKDYLRV